MGGKLLHALTQPLEVFIHLGGLPGGKPPHLCGDFVHA